MRLNVGEVGAEQLAGALDGQILGYVNAMTAAVVTLGGVALGVSSLKLRDSRSVGVLISSIFGDDCVVRKQGKRSFCILKCRLKAQFN